MRYGHFAAFQPVCPRCRLVRQVDAPLRIGQIVRDTPEGLIEGALHCSDPACFMEYPVLDGIPILMPGLRNFVQDNLLHLIARDDLSPALEGMLGDGAGPGTAFDATRQYLSSYGWDHYADRDPEEVRGDADGPLPGAVVRCLDAALSLVPPLEAGPILDLGCSVGRTTFELAGRSEGLVLGLDLNFAMLKLARRVMERGVVRYPRRRIGIVYDRREFPADFEGAERADFWLADALALPFADRTFGRVTSMNLLDCVAAPRDLLSTIGRVLRVGGHGVLATPYDWSGHATPVEAWLGGHSQRGPLQGASEPLLRNFLTPGHPQAIPGVELAGEIAGVPWQVRLHDRSTVYYRPHVFALRAR